jgi:hypothetical protein
MKLGVLSDTHENMTQIKKAVEIFNARKVDLVLHAGDVISPITYNEFKNLAARIVFVYGNNDGFKVGLKEKFADIGEFYTGHYETVLEGKKLVIMHEPDFLDEITRAGDYDVIIYGHTHKQDIKKIGNTLVLNPGECCGWITGKPTIVILTLPQCETEVINL